MNHVMQLQSTITCPQCRHEETETMRVDACQFFYDCKGCGAALRSRGDDSCIFCSYGSVPCPSVQKENRLTFAPVVGTQPDDRDEHE